MKLFCPVCGVRLDEYVEKCPVCGTSAEKILSKLKVEKDRLQNLDFPKYSTAELEEIFEFEESGSGYAITEFLGTDSRVFVPSRYRGRAVNAIRANAFEGSDVTEVYFPVSVREIEHDAFASCYKLTYVYLPDRLQEIGSSVFSDCTSLTSIEIPESVKSIGERCFSGCVALTKIKLPDGLEIIPSYCFENCTSLPFFIFGENIKEISSYAFLNCSGIKKIKYSECLSRIGDYAFSGCNSLFQAILPSSLVSLGEGVFHDCASLERVFIGEKTVDLYGDAFYGCNSLRRLVVQESNTAFYSSHEGIIARKGKVLVAGCRATVIDPEVVSIARSAFSGYSFDGVITIPSSVRVVESEAFFNNSTFTIEVDYPSKPDRWSDSWTIGDVNVVWKG